MTAIDKRRRSLATFLLLVTAAACTTVPTHPTAGAGGTDPYAAYVWPPPPDQARIRLVTILSGRPDVEAGSHWQAVLIGASPQSLYDWLKKPYGVAFDGQGRILVTDPALGALFRFDRQGRRLDVFGTTGSLRLKLPLGVSVAASGTIYVADAALRRVVAFDPAGKVVGAFGKEGELVNPTDAVVAPDGGALYVADSKGQRIVVFDLKSGDKTAEFGKRGDGEGEFNFPTSLAFDHAGNLYVVDQINCRVEVFSPDGEFLDTFGRRGVGFGDFVRPKGIAVDRKGLIYVTDGAFNNVQVFNPDLHLLTFVGGGGTGPGAFQVAAGVAVRGNEFAVVDELGHRVQLFRFLQPRTEE